MREWLRDLKQFVLLMWSFVCFFWLSCVIAYGESGRVMTVISAVWLVLFVIANFTGKKK